MAAVGDLLLACDPRGIVPDRRGEGLFDRVKGLWADCDVVFGNFECTLAGATLTSVSNLNTVDYVITTPEFGLIVEPLAEATAEGHLYYPQEYWEIVSLVVDVPPIGCGFSFSVDTFFSTSTGLLFDWAQSTMGVTLALGTSVSMSSTITVDTTGFTQWTLAFEVSF